ncbi:extracellular solute-binding protein [Cohnella abietis]|uniref:ABC transporter substrate-binding protein n=1 Tax=Cohnella abietis TaxID=2507935 RepID=A0A3T1D0L5_9BACL|nr:extracellular solute-binding protein [Cohnella abietis]BBI31601.1 ABC transporter substrate-binding protein [Cohnella abietis]
MRRKKRRIIITVSAVALLCIGLWFVLRPTGSDDRTYSVLSAEEIIADIRSVASTGKTPPSYVQWIRSKEYAAFKPVVDVKATVMATDYSAISSDAQVERRRDNVKGSDVIDWNNTKGWIEWQVEVTQDGLYELLVDYAPLKGGFSSVVRGIQIDGAYPFIDAERIAFKRLWKDSKYPYDRNSIGNEIRPIQEELLHWRADPVTNFSLSSVPLRWALTSGKHTIRLIGKNEPMSLHSLTLAAPEEIPAYSEYSSRQLANDTAKKNWYDIVEAERFAYKSSVNIQLQSVAEPYISPDPKGKIVYNAIGGTNWTKPGESIGWELSVPEDGYYAIDVKYYQGYNGKSSAYRTILIDGKIPFKEMQSYRFAPNKALQITTLSDGESKPYLFYFTKGKHLIEMTVDTSLIRPVTMSLLDINERLTVIEKDIRAITGNYGYDSVQNVDKARTWDMRKYDPDIETKLQSLVDDLLRTSDYLNGLNQAETDSATALVINADRLQQLLKHINDIPNRVTQFATIRTSINSWIQTIEAQAIELDYLVVRTPETETGLKVPGSWSKLRYSTASFFRSFFQKYDTSEADDGNALTVWVQRGKDYVDLLDLMAQQEFTLKTGIKVNINLIPNTNVLLLGNVAGDQPDIALGVPLETPVDFAMRGSAEDLSTYPGFEDVFKQFNPGLMRSYMYNDKVYGLPETQNYYMLFYRTDVFEELKIQPPDTWDDLSKILPTLQENGLTFNFSKKNFHIPFLQHGSDFYQSSGMEPNLTSGEGLAAFKQWTDWYSKYNLPKDIPSFIHHFRNGDIPIGIADFELYIQLTVAAPEIEGKWKMIPIPGIKQADGTVARWSHNESFAKLQEPSSIMMLKKSDRKDDAWKFIQWWTSAEVQSRYASDMESFAGIAYRWNTANLAAMQTIPWPDEDLAAINEQDRWVKNIPFVPGYYYLSREIEFAWNNVVVGHMPAREALEKSEMSLSREMMRKQEEFGITSEDQLHITPYDKPYERSTP